MNDIFGKSSTFNNNITPLNENIKIISREIKDVFKYQKLIKKKNLFQKKNFFELEIIIMKDYIQTEQDISLLIVIPFDYPKLEPEIYCLTEFCHPHICDGRNLLLDIIKTQWQKRVHNLDYIINKLPGFFVHFLEAKKKKGNYIVGQYILNKLYSISRLKELPIYCHLITHKEQKMSFTAIKSHKIITISEISFCMFELDNNHSGYCKLVFYADLKDLIGIQLDIKNNEIEIKWRNLLGVNKFQKIEIISPNCQNINKILLENQKKFLNYNNKELTEEEKKIMMIEKQILYVEKSLTVGDKPKKGQIIYLVNLYKTIKEYYLAQNQINKANEYDNKIKMFEPEINNYNKKEKNILIEDDKNENEKIDFDFGQNENNINNINIINQNFEQKTDSKEENKNNIINNNDLFNFNFNNNENNANININSNNNNINDIFNFIQPSSQDNNNNNNDNNAFDFGFDF